MDKTTTFTLLTTYQHTSFPKSISSSSDTPAQSNSATMPEFIFFTLFYLPILFNSYGETVGAGYDADKVETISKIPSRMIKVKFNADTSASMRWNFKPQQTKVKVIQSQYTEVK